MIHDITSEVYREIREYGDLTVKQVADAIGRRRQTVWRWESGQQVPTREQERILVEKAKLTIPAFGEIVARAMTKLTNRPFTMAPPADYVPSVPLARAFKQYSLHGTRIDPPTRERIEELLSLGRMADAQAEQACSYFAREALRLIEKALGESLSGD